MRNQQKRGKVTVIGSFNADIVAYTPVFPRDGETVHGVGMEITAGGKGSNQATAAHRVGGDVTMVTKLGGDFLANLAKEHYATEGMNTSYIFEDKTCATGSAVIEVNTVSGENRIIVAAGANNALTEDEIGRLENVISDSDVVLMQYEIPKECIAFAKRIADRNGVAVVVNPAPYIDMGADFLKGLECITPNETEARFLTGIDVDTEEDAFRAAEKLRSMGVKNVVITLGKRGAFYFGEDGKLTVKAIPAVAVDTTGAGDSFNGAMCVSIAEDIANSRRPDYIRAVRIGNCAGSMAVRSKGASKAMPYRHQVEQLYREQYKEE